MLNGARTHSKGRQCKLHNGALTLCEKLQKNINTFSNTMKSFGTKDLQEFYYLFSGLVWPQIHRAWP